LLINLTSAAREPEEATNDQGKHTTYLEQVIGCSAYATPVLQLYVSALILGAIATTCLKRSFKVRWGLEKQQ
jgi:hypothetical protein